MTDRRISSVLVANRGEIAVRIIRAVRDVGCRSVAVYADPDASARFVGLADESVALGGQTSAESYLDIAKVVAAAVDTGADAVHPGYGFLSENADFAQAVIDAGLTWIGPSPASIRALGDKVTARRIAEQTGAPMAAGTKDPVDTAAAVVEFAEKHGVPVAIKAAHGGGGRGMKIARTLDEIPELFEAATREARAAFGRSECFVEQYLDRARHVEAQVIADQHGAVVVAGTRDCSLQRRFQKLVEEAPAPFLSEVQRSRIAESAKEICRAAGYHGVGTVEFLVQDDTISFLEVNTRLQVEHPVTEETSGIDLVEQQFRIAEGKHLEIVEDPTPRGHSIEFRINGEDAGRGFLPMPGRITDYREPSGPGVRVDSGVTAGDEIGGQFDSMLAKLVVTGADRQQALRRAARALAEFRIDGMATVLPFHRHIVTHPAFVGDGDSFGVYTTWIESEWENVIEAVDLDDVAMFDDALEIDDPSGLGEVVVGEAIVGDHSVASAAGASSTVVVEVDGCRVEVSFPGGRGAHTATTRTVASATRTVDTQRNVTPRASKPPRGAVVAPMQGTVVQVSVTEGQEVSVGDPIAVLEAMKMENPIMAHRAGIVADVAVETGAPVARGAVLAEIVEKR
ncbi:acetyl/propionyl/methylcrotonyl-CoA carboxylase subunit alpha [Gordonia soli]|uniref:Biotin-dependent acyl-coenzyme A carboxylase alpha3 subunit n=1 Tax=Gordonia soli NBRC 108243 TaxID=1223545 RepID=M0QGJ2_9ACTN|nr:biotin carboxylase N-terminal domain-containing protein [Gordonia soli]GAC67396.1 putative acyl-CoA carboxylase alpha chain [Gordonia soli NBRC 108243]